MLVLLFVLRAHRSYCNGHLQYRLDKPGSVQCARSPAVHAGDICMYGNVQVNEALLGIRARGGIALKDVIGQSEQDEMPAPYPNPTDLLVGSTGPATGRVLAVVRAEYVNVWHTMNDLYNAFVAMALYGWHHNEVDIVFWDGHPAGILDPLWHRIFRSVRYANATVHAPVRKLIILPQNYKSTLTARISAHGPCIRDNRDIRALISAFAPRVTQRGDVAAVVVVGRLPNLTHPREKVGAVRGLTTPKVAIAIQEHIRERHVVYLSQFLPLLSQVRLVQSAFILCGAHGAGLTWIMALSPRARGVIEWGPILGDHYSMLAAEMGVSYTRLQRFSARAVARESGWHYEM